MIKHNSDDLYTIVQDSSENYPNNVAIYSPGMMPLRYRGLFSLIKKIHSNLLAFGINNTDRVGLVISDGPELATAVLAVSSFCQCTPFNPNLKPDEFSKYLKDLRINVLIIECEISTSFLNVTLNDCRIFTLIKEGNTAGEFSIDIKDNYAKNQKSSDRVLPTQNDIAIVLSTSGTTSAPKIVPLTHKNICFAAKNICKVTMLSSADCCLNVMPLFHIHGLSTIFSSLIVGASVICPRGFNAPLFFQWMKEYSPSWYTAAPAIHQSILHQFHDKKINKEELTFRFIRSASSALPHRVIKDYQNYFKIPVIEAYGMTEASPQIASNPLPPQKTKIGSVGCAAGPEIGIVDENGVFLVNSTIGEIVVRGQNLFSKYENNDKANSDSFFNDWFRTGDQGYLDSDGYLFITGRLKEIINRGGEKISPREIDEILLSHPEVLQAVTFSIADEKLGEIVGCAVVCKNKNRIDQTQLRKYLSHYLSDFKVPSVIIFIDDLPKEATGKIQRISLAEKFKVLIEKERNHNGKFESEEKTIDNVDRVLNLNVETIKGIWQEILRNPIMNTFDNFFDIGGDSLLAARIVTKINIQLNCKIDIIDFLDNPTIDGLSKITNI